MGRIVIFHSRMGLPRISLFQTVFDISESNGQMGMLLLQVAGSFSSSDGMSSFRHHFETLLEFGYPSLSVCASLIAD
jgi:hypothetical protein